MIDDSRAGEKYAGCIDARVIEFKSFKQWRKFLSVNLSIPFFLVTFLIPVYGIRNFEKLQFLVCFDGVIRGSE